MHYRKMPAIFSVLTFAILVFSAVAGEEQKKMAEVEEAIPETAEQGTVVFYRVRSAKGGAIRLNISGGNDGTVGILSNGSKIVKKFPVGEYTFTISSPSIAGTDTQTLKIEAGKTYYLKGIAKLGWPAARSRFTLMDEEKGKAESDKIK